MLSTAGGQIPSASQGSDQLLRGAKAGPWIVERELGRGGMGAVYAVVHEEIGKRAALKVVHRKLLSAGFNPDRMLVEARVVNQVAHPNIVDIFETGKLPDGRPYIVMERLDGESLASRADAGPLPPELSIAILRQVCDALIAAHAAGIIHRDLKLDNVFLVDNLEDPSTLKVKLLDWGIAKELHQDARHTIEGQLVGTPQYLSPEQARGANVTPKTDVYSLGVMAYELFLDQLPFEAETSAEIMAMHLRAAPPPPHELWSGIPEQLERLLLEMLAKRADHRPTMLEAATRLDAIRAELETRRPSSKIAALARPASISRPMPAQTPPAPARLARASEAPRRRASADAHAPTKLAPSQWWRAPLQHWRYAAGGIAIAGCIVMILVTRGGDSAAAAAAAPPATAAEVPALTAGDHAATAELAPGPAAAAPVPTVAAAAAAAPEIIQIAGAPVADAPGALASELRGAAAAHPPRKSARPAGKSGAASRAAGSSSSTRRAPAAPRRNAKLDPDGTIDPYQ